MRRNGRSRVVSQVAAGASRRCPREPVSYVTLTAGGLGEVRAGQPESRRRIVVEDCTTPTRGVMTKLTTRRKSSRRVSRVRGPLVNTQVTDFTVARGPSKLVIHMTLAALHSRMYSGERKSSRRRMIETRSPPGRGRMTDRTILRESRGRMIRVRGALECGQMTTLATRSRAFKYAVDVTLAA